MSVWKILICHVKSISYLYRINKITVYIPLRCIRIGFIYLCDLFCAQTMNSHWEFSIRFVVMVLLYVRIDHTYTYTHINLSVAYSETVQILKKWNKNGAFSEHRSTVMAILIGTSNSHSLPSPYSPLLCYPFVVWWTQKFDSYELIRVPWQHSSIPGSLFAKILKRPNTAKEPIQCD